jgi:hypothetical protein
MDTRCLSVLNAAEFRLCRVHGWLDSSTCLELFTSCYLAHPVFFPGE